MAIPDTAPPTANAMAIAIKWYLIQAGSVSPDSPNFLAALTANVTQEIATLEHKSTHDPSVVARARVAAATVYASRAGRDTAPGSGDITNLIGGTVSEAGGNPIVKAIKAPITIAEFLARLTDVHIWIRVAEVAGGAWLGYIGIKMLAREGTIPLPRG